jgi:hypothetical protein
MSGFPVPMAVPNKAQVWGHPITVIAGSSLAEIIGWCLYLVFVAFVVEVEVSATS